MQRNLEKHITTDLSSKIVLITGPRQCGKTTLSRSINSSIDYLNFDLAEDRQIIKNKSWDRDKKLIIFDELHKMREWKRWVKGVYDTEGIPPEIIVTGSAQIETYRKVGDSLAGRYFKYNLHPLDLKEVAQYTEQNNKEIFNTLWECSGFPEPFFKANKTFYKRWRRTHMDIILRQDLLDLYAISDIKAIEDLVLLLKDRVGSSVSYANLARDLQRDASTVKRWLTMLENLYIIFRVTPYNKKISRSLLKEPKFYFYDHAYAEKNPGAHLENIVACALLKELDFITDTTGVSTKLHYMRTKEGKEIDFLICQDDTASHMIEIKSSETSPAAAFDHFTKFLPHTKKLQLVKSTKRTQSYPSGVKVCPLIDWLQHVDLL